MASKKAVETDEMLQILSKTKSDIAIIAANLKTTGQRINSSNALWALLNDQSIPQELKTSLVNIRRATGKAGNTVNDLHAIITDVKNGKGSVGALLTDTSFAQNLDEAIAKIKKGSDEGDLLAGEINKVVAGLRNDVNNGKGTVNALLNDSMMAIILNASLDNIQRGTDGFNQNMEALKHNFLFRGYFKKQEKAKAERRS